MYLRHTYDAIIDGNTIHANGVGDPIKLREDCRRTIIRNNKVYVGCWGFIVDYPESTESASSDTEIYDNFFYLNDDSTSVNTDLDIYKGPVWNPNRSPFISEFYDNTMNCEFSGDDGHYVYGVACEDTCTYVAVNQPDYHRNYIYKFLKREGPIFKICLDQLPYYNNIRGDMCTTDSYVIASTVKYIDA
ncbi:MAG: hypothetical protein JXB48_16695, partial [Candidatus Latescibacteria bacterium]|nr:hypothetical protein [Candidatus Latescibacterota bacterium]